MNFISLLELQNAFRAGEIKFPDDITITLEDDRTHTFTMLEAKAGDWIETISGGDAYMLYGARIDEAMTWIGFRWTLREGSIVPAAADAVEYRMKLEEEVDPKASVISDEVKVRITSLRDAVVNAKADTGATVCSLHADSYKIEGDTVKFISKAISPNTISVPLSSQQAVKTAGNGVEYRPVIELDIVVGEKSMRVKFNLNDRSNMDHPILLGQNALEKGKFLIDPSAIKETIHVDWDHVTTQLNESTLPEVSTEDKTATLFAQFEEHARQSSDFVREIRSLLATK